MNYEELAAYDAMDFQITELPDWRSLDGTTMPPWNTGITSSSMEASILKNKDNNNADTSAITILAIKQLHRCIAGSGAFREKNVGTENVTYINHELVSNNMESLVHVLDKILLLNNKNMFKVSAWFLAKFLAIHPFEDGNGRVGRQCVARLLKKTLGFDLQLPGNENKTLRLMMADCIMRVQVCSPTEARITHPKDLAAFLLDCAFVASNCRIERTLAVYGPAGTGKTTLINRFKDLDLDGDGKFKTTKFSYAISEGKDEAADVRLCLLDTSSSRYDSGTATVIGVNKIEALDPYTAAMFYDLACRKAPGRKVVMMEVKTGRGILKRAVVGQSLLEALDGE